MYGPTILHLADLYGLFPRAGVAYWCRRWLPARHLSATPSISVNAGHASVTSRPCRLADDNCAFLQEVYYTVGDAYKTRTTEWNACVWKRMLDKNLSKWIMNCNSLAIIQIITCNLSNLRLSFRTLSRDNMLLKPLEHSVRSSWKLR
jgi:hypothetical protein